MKLVLTHRIGPRCCACVRACLCVNARFRECVRVCRCALCALVASAPAGQGRGGSEWIECVRVYVARCMMCAACCVQKVVCGPMLRVAFSHVTHDTARTAALLQASMDVLPLLPANSTSKRSARAHAHSHACARMRTQPRTRTHACAHSTGAHAARARTQPEPCGTAAHSAQWRLPLALVPSVRTAWCLKAPQGRERGGVQSAGRSPPTRQCAAAGASRQAAWTSFASRCRTSASSQRCACLHGSAHAMRCQGQRSAARLEIVRSDLLAYAVYVGTGSAAYPT